MDVVSTVTGTVGLIKAAKDAYDIAKKLDNQDLRQLLADIREQSLDLQEELISLRKANLDLCSENERIKQAIDTKPNMRPGNHHIWEVKDNEVFGPYCVTCWEADQRNISMIRMARTAFIICPKCNKTPIMPHMPPPEWGLSWKQ